VHLTISDRAGTQIVFKLKDCASNGMCVHSPDKSFDKESLNLGEIVSSSKLTWADKEVSLGRLVLRRLVEKDSFFELAFSTVDIQVPVSGALSHCLDLNLSDDASVERELDPDSFSLAHFIENEYTNADLFDRVREFSFFHAEWVKSKKYAYQNIRHKSKGSRIEMKRPRKGGRTDYLVMGSNDYLGLGSHPEVVEAAKQALDIYGFGSTGSPVTTGSTDAHVELAECLARIHHKESAILFNSGYVANIGIISSIAGPSDLIVADQLCHASIQDGMRMCTATSRFFKHNNVEHLEQILKNERNNHNGCLVITEGVFSMDGDVAKLDEIVKIARRYNCRIMVDQAHCFGVVGPTGMGACEKYGVFGEVDIIMGTFSKICGGIGGFAVCSKDVTNWLRSFSRAQIFSVSIPPSTACAMLKALEVFRRDKELLANLRTNIAHFTKSLREMGCDIPQGHESAVVPVVVGDESLMGGMYQSLLEDGVVCTPVVFPAVSRRNCRFRFTVTASHSISDLDYAVSCLERASMKSNFSFSAPRKETKKAA
jgi:8-amino-7-oxononanoate synthase